MKKNRWVIGLLAAFVLLGGWVLLREVRVRRDEKGHRTFALRKPVEANARTLFRLEPDDVRRLEVTVREVDYTKLEQERKATAPTPASPPSAGAAAPKGSAAPTPPPPAPAKTDKPAESAPAPASAPASAQAEVKERRIAVAREGDNWVIAEPVHAEADKASVETMVKAFTDLTYTSKLADVTGAAQDDLRYGVSVPSLVAKCWYGRGGKQMVEVELGRDYGSGQYCIVRGIRGLDQPLWIVSTSLKTSLDKKLADLRSKKVATYESDDINRIIVRRPDGEVECVRAKPKDKKSKDWRLVRPIEADADQTAVGDLVNAVSGAEAKDFVDTYAALTPYGLDRPDYEVTLYFRDKDKQPVKVAFGKTYATTKQQPDTTPSYNTEDEKKSENLSLVYCKRVGRDEIMGVEKRLLETLRKTTNSLRDHRATDFKVPDVEQVTIQPRDGDALTLTRAGSTWSFSGGGEADRMKVDDLLYALNSLNADDFLTKEQEADFNDQQAGLARPLVKITLKLTKRSEDYVIAFGDPVPWRPNLTYCRTSDTPTPVLVDQTKATKIPITKAALEPAKPAPTTGTGPKAGSAAPTPGTPPAGGLPAPPPKSAK